MEEIFYLIKKEEKRQAETINLIASENYPFPGVLDFLGTVLNNKYSEGYPGARYHGGNEFVDQIERIAQSNALKIFGLDQKRWHCNVQPLSGTPANLAIYFGLLKKGDKAMAMSLEAGGHLSHGLASNLSGQFYHFIYYEVGKDGFLDYQKIEKKALKEKPKLIICGSSAYPRIIDFKKFGQIAKKSNAYLMADISHIAGLIVGGIHPSPFPYADVVTSTTHKTLRGPRGAIIICRKILAKKIDSAVFPGLQGGPHDHQTAAIAFGLGEILKPSFKKYPKQVVSNAKKLALELQKRGYKILTGGTDNHLVVLDLRPLNVSGKDAEEKLEKVGIVSNRETIPGDKLPPRIASGLRLGTPAVTSRGMKEKEMEKIAELISEILKSSKFTIVKRIKKEVKSLCKKFPLNKI